MEYRRGPGFKLNPFKIQMTFSIIERYCLYLILFYRST